MYTLTPTQQRALGELLAVMRPGAVVALHAQSGNGKSTLIRAAREQTGGMRVGAVELQAAIAGRHPLAVEDGLYQLVDEALKANETVFVDDLDLVTRVVEGCQMYPRGGYVRVALQALTERVAATGRTIVVATSRVTPAVHSIGSHVSLKELDADDYRVVCREYLSDAQVGALDFAKIHRYARRMTARQLRRACEGVRERLDAIDATDAADVFIEYLRSAQLVSNVDLGEVQTVRLEDLKGLDDVLRALEANVIMPLEHSELATELSLKPKRGVLLAGPPGTGKTTIGRALAHRLRGKFFLIDGTVIAGTPMFYQQLHTVFEAAMRNAPSIVFIDNSDVIFEGQDPGLYRYLLTMLDGLESESAGGVCLMLTAMDVAGLPPALVRSGRIELWLETRLPDEAARAQVLADLCANLPTAIGAAVDVTDLARMTADLSGADLKRVIEDGKLLYAFDRSRGVSPDDIMRYFREALETVRANKIRYAQAEASARARNPQRPPQFNMGFMGGPPGQAHETVHFVRAEGIEIE